MSFEYQDQVLGMIVCQNKRYWDDVKNFWEPEMFQEISRIKIAKAILELNQTGQDVNMMTVVEKVGGEVHGYVGRVIVSYTHEVNINYFVSQLLGWYRIKQSVLPINNICQKIIKSKFSDKIDPVINEIKLLVEKIEHCSVSVEKYNTMPDMVSSTAERIEKRIELSTGGKPRGASFGLSKLDYFLAGLIPGRFYITAARTSVGKTSFASWMTLQAIKQGSYPIFFSNEMDKEDLIEKLIAAEGRISTQKFQSGDLTDSELTRFMATANELAKLKLCVDEKSGWDLDQLLATVHRLHRLGKCDMVFVDYLQQVRVKSSKSKYEQVSTVSDAMKRLSRDLNIPVIGLAQINREAERGSREDIPTLAHLKDSGSLEQDADVVMILHKRDISDQELTLRVAKNRYGQTGDIKLKHLHQFNIYEEL
jgi:replicative DNA helicase